MGKVRCGIDEAEFGSGVNCSVPTGKIERARLKNDPRSAIKIPRVRVINNEIVRHCVRYITGYYCGPWSYVHAHLFGWSGHHEVTWTVRGGAHSFQGLPPPPNQEATSRS